MLRDLKLIVFLILGFPSFLSLCLRNTLMVTAVVIRNIEVISWHLMEIFWRVWFQLTNGASVRNAAYLDIDGPEIRFDEMRLRKHHIELNFLSNKLHFFVQLIVKNNLLKKKCWSHFDMDNWSVDVKHPVVWYGSNWINILTRKK